MVMVKRTMMMMMINRQPVIKWCLTDTSALWDSSVDTGPVSETQSRLAIPACTGKEEAENPLNSIH